MNHASKSGLNQLFINYGKRYIKFGPCYGYTAYSDMTTRRIYSTESFLTAVDSEEYANQILFASLFLTVLKFASVSLEIMYSCF